MMDKEILNTFKIESEEQLQKLEKMLLFLEKNPHDKQSLDEAFRGAHTLKGSARMLGFTDIEAIAHHFEDILGEARREKITLETKIIDLLYQGVDSIAKLTKSILSGTKSDIDVLEIIEKLTIKPEPKMIGGTNEILEFPKISWKLNLAPTNNKNNAEEKETKKIPTKKTISKPKAKRKTAKKLQNSQVPETIKKNGIEEKTSLDKAIKQLPEVKVVSPIQATKKAEVATVTEKRRREDIILSDVAQINNSNIINTIHVESQKLDSMITNIGELAIAKNRIEKRSEDVGVLIDHYESLYSTLYKNRLALREHERNLNQEQKKIVKTLQDELLNVENMRVLLKNLQNKILEDNTKLDLVTLKLEEEIRQIRLLPLSTIFDLYPRMVRDIAKEQQKKINFVIQGENTTVDKYILEEIKSPLMHLLRNAIDHGIELPEERKQKNKNETATIRIKGYQTSTSVMIEVSDDGKGIDIGLVKSKAIEKNMYSKKELLAMSNEEIQSLIFDPGFSTKSTVSHFSGRGMGMNIVQNNVEKLKGNIRVRSVAGESCLFEIQLPITIATNRVLVVSLKENLYAVPIEYVFTSYIINEKDFFYLEGCNTTLFENMSISVAHLAELLEFRVPIVKNSPCVILQIGDEYIGILVDELIDVQEIVVKPNSTFLKRVRNISGAAILESGEVCMVLNPVDLLKTMRKNHSSQRTHSISQSSSKEDGDTNILVADDSILTRLQLKRNLEGAGYNVITAVDGQDAFSKLKKHSVKAVVSDVEMPNMDGFSLTQKIRLEPRLRELPVILLTSLSSAEDRKKGLDCGASAYLTKESFEQKQLLESLKNLIL